MGCVAALFPSPRRLTYGVAQRLSEYIYKPFRKMMDANPDLRQHFPFECVDLSLPLLRVACASQADSPCAVGSIQIKKMEKSYGIEAVLREHLPSLQHGSDGLIFTSAVGPYVTGTDEKMFARSVALVESNVVSETHFRFLTA